MRDALSVSLLFQHPRDFNLSEIQVTSLSSHNTILSGTRTTKFKILPTAFPVNHLLQPGPSNPQGTKLADRSI